MLADSVMGWKPAPGRYIKSGRSWITKWRFRPFAELADAFQLLDQAAVQYSISRDQTGTFTATVQVGAQRGQASGELKPRVITLAVVRALGMEVGQ